MHRPRELTLNQPSGTNAARGACPRFGFTDVIGAFEARPPLQMCQLCRLRILSDRFVPVRGGCMSANWYEPDKTDSSGKQLKHLRAKRAGECENTRRERWTRPGLKVVNAMERCGNRRPRVERLVSAWNQGIREDAESEVWADDPLIGASAEPKKRPRTRLTDSEVDAMRTAGAPVRCSPGHGMGEDALTRPATTCHDAPPSEPPLLSL